MSSFSIRHRYVVLALLLTAYIMSFIDRNNMAVLVGPIRDDFNINDFQYGLLNGLAFSLMYTFMGIPIGWLADRTNRKNIMSAGVAFWSVMATLCGLATNFFTLFLARVGVGVGEAALSPPAHSILSDYFDKKALPAIMAIFTLGIPVGVGISYSLGGWVYGLFAEYETVAVPLLGDLKPWQLTFIMLGVPGLLLAAVMYYIAEPRRTGLMQQADQQTAFSIRQVAAFLAIHKRVYLGIYGAVACLAIMGYGFMLWFVAHMSRVFGPPEYEISQPFGLLYLVFGSLGTLFGACLSAYLSRCGHVDAGVRTILLVALLWLVPAVTAPLMPSLNQAYLMAAPCIFFLNAYFGVSIASLQLVTPNQMRAQVSALLLFMGNVFGLALGPAIIGLLSDTVFAGSSHSLGYALMAVNALFCPLAILCIAISFKPYRELSAMADKGWR